MKDFDKASEIDKLNKVVPICGTGVGSIKAFDTSPRRSMVNVGIKLRDDSVIAPAYAHEYDACADIRWNDPDKEFIRLHPNTVYKLRTGVSMQIPRGFKVLMSIRSGMACKGMIMATNPGIIDSGYQDEISIIVTVLSEMMIKKNDRIAQLSVEMVHGINWIDWYEQESDRNGGLGSSGIR